MQGSSGKSLKVMIEEAGADLIGTRVRRIREKQGFSLREVAALADISKNTLLRMEQGFLPRVSTLRQVAKALRVKPVVLCSLDWVESPVIGMQKLDHMRWYDMDNFKGHGFPIGTGQLSDEERRLLGESGVTPFSAISSVMDGNFFFPNLIELFGSTPRRSHPGMEFCYVLAGEIEIVFEDLKFQLVQGESMSFHSSEVHHYLATGNQLPARILSIVVYFGEGLRGRESSWGWVRRDST